MAKSRARVLVDIEATDDLKLIMRRIRVVDDDITLDDATFEWFNQIGHSPQDARRNCVEAIAFFARCRPELRASIVQALDVSCANDVACAIEAKT